MPRDPQGAGTRTETPNERYERLAEEFYAETGKMAPGKDVPAEYASDDYEERGRLWLTFLRSRRPLPPHAGEETKG